MRIQEAAPLAESREILHFTAAKSAPTDERLLVSQAKSGCPHSFGELYQRHRPRTYRTVLRILGNHQDAEDAVQRTFQRAFTHLDRFREDSTFPTWVTRIAINEALMLLRQKCPLTSISHCANHDVETPSAFDPPDEHPTPEQVVTKAELHTALLQAISGLRENLRSVVLLKELQGLTSAETARRLGLTVSAVKARLFHARRFLRRHLERRYKHVFVSSSTI
jgi:RNA polymerase sigma-70 factor, ECF subfamily